MIKRLAYVILAFIAIVFVPYYLGQIETFDTLNEVPYYIRGIMYIITFAVVIIICVKAYDYVVYGEGGYYGDDDGGNGFGL